MTGKEQKEGRGGANRAKKPGPQGPKRGGAQTFRRGEGSKRREGTERKGARRTNVWAIVVLAGVMWYACPESPVECGSSRGVGQQ